MYRMHRLLTTSILAVCLISCLVSEVGGEDGKKRGDASSTAGSGNDRMELDPNPHLACSACEAITYVIMAHIQSRRYEGRAKTVQEMDPSGQVKTVPYMTSATHVETVVSSICDMADMSLLKKKQGWLGQSRYEFDDIPSYRQDHLTEPSLMQACREMTQGRRSGELKRLLLSAIRSSDTSAVPAAVCIQIFSVCKWKLTKTGRFKVGLEEAFFHDPSVVVRLLPFAVILGCLPFVFMPVFVSSPPPRDVPPPGHHQESAIAQDKSKAASGEGPADPKRRGPTGGKGKKKRT